MQRLYFNLATGDVRLVPDVQCPTMDKETSFPNTLVPDDVTLDMVSFKIVNGVVQPQIKYPSIATTSTTPTSGGSGNGTNSNVGGMLIPSAPPEATSASTNSTTAA